MQLETVLAEKFYKLVEIHLESGAVFKGYLIGIKLPVVEILMLYYVPEKHIDKYIKHQNACWVEQLPYVLLKEIKLLSGGDSAKEALLKEVVPRLV